MGIPLKLTEEDIADAVGLAAGDVEVKGTDPACPRFRRRDPPGRFMLTDRNVEPMMDFPSNSGATCFNAAPCASGIDVCQDVNEEALAPTGRMERACARHGIPPGAAALQFSMRDPRVAATICDISKRELVQVPG